MRKYWNELARNTTTDITRDNFRCRECSSRDRLDIHHKIPRSQAGQDDLENLLSLCKGCHAKQKRDYIKGFSKSWGSVGVTTVREVYYHIKPSTIMTLPKSIAEQANIIKGDKMTIYTDGDRIYIDRFKEPEI